jgi:hypothetical protein
MPVHHHPTRLLPPWSPQDGAILQDCSHDVAGAHAHDAANDLTDLQGRAITPAYDLATAARRRSAQPVLRALAYSQFTASTPIDAHEEVA